MNRAWLADLLSPIADRGLRLVGLPPADVPPVQRARALAQALLSGRGEASGTALARELVELGASMKPDDKLAFLKLLAAEFGPNESKLRAAAAAYAETPSMENLLALWRCAEPPRQELLRRMNMAPDGTAALVRLREFLLAHLKGEPGLAPLETDLKHLLSSWFNRGFLQVSRIDWRTPAAILEKLIAYEAVHEIRGWDDLRRRLASDRRCFAFFHPALRDEPLIFVEIALVKGLAASVQDLLIPDTDADTDAGAERPKTNRPDTAIFYSISNCQPGLRGISFGNFLIKQVVDELKLELPGLKTFSTLSPIPGFRAWLDRRLAADGKIEPDDRLVLAGLQDPAWHETPKLAAKLKEPLLRLCAEYLVAPDSPKGTSDPVARFHLGNGARVERINFLGDTSPKGLRESHGLMVNYLYDLGSIVENHEAFAARNQAAHSAAVERLLARPGGTRLARLLRGR